MAVLSVNVNKIATLRNSRGGNNPDVLQTSLDIIQFGAEGITVHPRPDGRHIRHADVYALADKVSVEFNIEGYPDENFLKLVKEVKPAQCTLVPDPPEALTSNAGWKISENLELLKRVVGELKDEGVRVSLFYDPNDFSEGDLRQAREEVLADRIELYTESYAKAFHTEERDEVLSHFQKTARFAVECGLGVNAGHDLDLKNLAFFLKSVPEVMEVSIGHALICDALYLGLEKTIAEYLKACH